MSMKLKVLGLGLLAVLATSAFAVVNASANRTGHFTQDSGGTATITGTESGEHRLKFRSDGGTAIVCDKAHYHGSVTVETTEEIRVTPTWEECHTEGQAAGTTEVDTNGCHLKFTSNANASTHEPTEHATAGVVCPAGKTIEVTHPNCTMRMPPQTIKGVTYTTIMQKFEVKPGEFVERHAITINSTVDAATAERTITAHYEGGICIFLGTTHKGTMIGSATVEGFNNLGQPINITAT